VFLTVFSKQVEASTITDVNIIFDGQVSIDTQVNSVSVDYNKTCLDISEVGIKNENLVGQAVYTNLECEEINNGVYKYTGSINQLKNNETITIFGRLISDDLGIDTTFNKTFTKDDILNNEEFENDDNNYNIVFSANDLKDLITYDVVFKSDEGGAFCEELDNVEYFNIIPYSEFPEIPDLKANDEFKFLGWYDEIQDCYIENFPESVDRDYVISAKWEAVNDNKFEANECEVLNLESYNPSRSTREHNVMLLIVSYIIRLSLSA
jgi:hypothetical protein